MGFIINPYLVQPSGPAQGPLTTAWIAATGETDLTIIGALNTLESDLTTYGLTSKMKALYPFVGGTAAKHKFNFMDARDLDAAFRLVFNGGWTHSSTGALPNGTNAYADTKLVPSSNFSANNSSFGAYSRTNNVNDGVLLGSATTASNRIFMFVNFNGSGGTQFNHNANDVVAPILSTSNGLFTSTRVSSGVQKVFYNSSVIGTTTSAEAFSTASIFLSAYNSGSGAAFFSNRQLAFSYIGNGLTDTEAANFYTAVQAFQTTLSRQV